MLQARGAAEAQLRQSEERFRQMAENINDVFFLLDPKSNRVLYISPAYETIWGRSCESLYQNPDSWAEAIHPDDRAAAWAASEQGASAGHFEFEYRIVRPDGTIRDIEARGFPVRDEAGAVVRIAGVAKDVTERKLVDAALSQTQTLLGAIVSSSDDALISKTLDGIVTSWNGGAERIFGYQAAEMLGQSISVLAVPGEEDDMKLVLDMIRRDQRVEHYETKRRRRDGEIIDISLSCSPIRNSDGKNRRSIKNCQGHYRAEEG